MGYGGTGYGSYGYGGVFGGGPGYGAKGAPQAYAGYGARGTGKGCGNPVWQASARQPAAPPESIVVSGCQHGTVGSIVRGTLTLHSENHGKPVYKKDSQVNGLDVMLYFWDDRDGPNFCGWWFGPKVGGDQVWAYHPEKTSNSPPSTGWKVPYDGPVDATFSISPQTGGTKRAAEAPTPGYGQPTKQSRTDWDGSNTASSWGQSAPSWNPARNRQEELEKKRFEAQQQQKRVEEMKKKQMEENKRRIDEANRKRAEDQRIKKEEQRLRIEQMKTREEELKRKREEDLKRAAEELKRKREEDQRKKEEEIRRKKELEEKRRSEQKATLSIRRVIQKVRVATPDLFDDLQIELEEILKTELENTGAQQARMREEADKGLEQARKRIEQIAEHRRKEEEQKAEEERKLKEAEERSKELIKELGDLIDAAEEGCKMLKEAASPLDSELFGVDDVEVASQKVEDAAVEAKAMTKACTDFILSKGSEMKEHVRQAPGAPPSETKQHLAKLLQRINDCTRGTEAAILAARQSKSKSLRRAAAREKTKAMQKVFDRYDKDADDMLSRSEVMAYAKGEYDFSLTDEQLDVIFQRLVEGDDKGLKFGNFQLMKVAVGVRRQMARDKERRAEREEKDHLLKEMKRDMQEKVKEAGKAVNAADQDVSQVEKQVQPLTVKARTMPAPDMTKLSDETDEMIAGAKQNVAAARKQIESLSADIDDRFREDLQSFLTTEAKQLEMRMGRMDSRLSRATNLSVRFRDQATKKVAAELENLRVKALKVVRYNQMCKKLSNDEVFDLFDMNKDGVVDEAEFVLFFEQADKGIKLPSTAELDAEEERGESAKPAEETAESVGGNGEDDAAVEKPDEPRESKEAPVGEEVIDLSTDELTRLFAHMCEEEEYTMQKETLLRQIRVYMKVVKETAMTASMSIKESKTLRRLEVNEVVEVIEGPVLEESVGVQRVRAKVMKDNLEGWITTAGNQGTVFLQEGGNVFKVVKETILTESFDLESKKEETRKLKDTTRKLKEGEMLQMYEWPMKDEKSGVLRMKGKVLSDGSVGWVTTTGNQGKVFLQVK